MRRMFRSMYPAVRHGKTDRWRAFGTSGWCEEIRGRQRAQLGELVSALRFSVFEALLLPLRERRSAMKVFREESGAAFGDGANKEALGQRRTHQVGNRNRSRGLAENRYPVGVATERCNILTHPFQGRNLVQ